MNKNRTMIMGIIALSFLLGLYLYPLMPERMVSHWGIYGEPNSFSSKFIGLFLMPFLSLFIFILFVLLPRLDPLRENIEKFRKYFERFILLIVGFLAYIYLLTITWNLGFRFSLIQFLAPAFAVLFYSVSVLLKESKRNWFIGIRTPWTLSSDEVWDKTHKLGAKLFALSAVISILGVVLPNLAIYFVILPIVLFSVYLFFYSYLVYRKTKPASK